MPCRYWSRKRSVSVKVNNKRVQRLYLSATPPIVHKSELNLPAICCCTKQENCCVFCTDGEGVFDFKVGVFSGDLLSRPNPWTDVLSRGAHLLREQRSSRQRQARAGTQLLTQLQSSLDSPPKRLLTDGAFWPLILRPFSGWRHGADQSGAPETRPGQESGDGYRQRGHSGSMIVDSQRRLSLFLPLLYCTENLSDQNLLFNNKTVFTVFTCSWM